MSRLFKNLMLFILIVACLFNITIKFVRRYSLKEELRASAQYILNINKENKDNKDNK